MRFFNFKIFSRFFYSHPFFLSPHFSIFPFFCFFILFALHAYIFSSSLAQSYNLQDESTLEEKFPNTNHISLSKTLLGVYNESDNKNIKIAIDVEGDITEKVFTLQNPPRIVIDLENTTSKILPVQRLIEDDSLLKSIRADFNQPTVVRVVLELKYLLPYKALKSKSPDNPVHNKLIVFINREYQEITTEKPIRKGITYKNIKKLTENGPLSIHILDIDKQQAKVLYKVALAQNDIGSKETLSEFVKRTKAFIGINGGYFNIKTGLPIDLLIIGGKVLSLPARYRAFWGIDYNQQFIFTYPTAEMSGEMEDGTGRRFFIHGLNRPPVQNEMVLFTPEYGTSTQTFDTGAEFTIRNNFVTKKEIFGSIIPQDGYVLSIGSQLLSTLSSNYTDFLFIGQKVKFKISSYPDLFNIKYGFSAGPMLVENGMPVEGPIEDFSLTSDIVSKRNPRTAIGVTESQHTIFLVIDGRSMESVGITLDELAEYMVSLGIVKGMNLDGGGSSEMVIGEKIVNIPSDGKERPISTAIMIY